MSRDGEAPVENSLNSEVILSWADGDLSLGVFTLLLLCSVFAFLPPANCVFWNGYRGCRTRNMLRTEVFRDIGDVMLLFETKPHVCVLSHQ